MKSTDSSGIIPRAGVAAGQKNNPMSLALGGTASSRDTFQLPDSKSSLSSRPPPPQLYFLTIAAAPSAPRGNALEARPAARRVEPGAQLGRLGNVGGVVHDRRRAEGAERSPVVVGQLLHD